MIKEFNNGKINSLEYMILVIFSSRSLYNGIGIQNMLNYSKIDTWMSILLGFIIGFIPLFVVMHLNKKKINLFELIKSKIIKFIFMVFLIFTLITLLNDFTNFASLQYLFETPNLVIALLVMIPSLYIVNKGIETIGRASLFMFYISIILFLVNSISLFQYIEIDNLKPLLKDGVMPVLYSSLHFVSYSLAPILFLSIIPKNDEDYKTYNKKLILGYIISSLSIFIIVFYVTTVFNYQYTSLFNYPVYFILKKIEYEFLSNVENVVSLFFVIDYFFTILVYMYSIKYYLKNEIHLKDKIFNIVYIIVTCIIIYIAVFVYKDINIVHIVSNDLLFYALSAFIILFIIIVPILLRKIDVNKS